MREKVEQTIEAIRPAIQADGGDIRLHDERARRTILGSIACNLVQGGTISCRKDQGVCVGGESPCDARANSGTRTGDDDRLVCHLYPALP